MYCLSAVGIILCLLCTEVRLHQLPITIIGQNADHCLYIMCTCHHIMNVIEPNQSTVQSVFLNSYLINLHFKDLIYMHKHIIICKHILLLYGHILYIELTADGISVMLVVVVV